MRNSQYICPGCQRLLVKEDLRKSGRSCYRMVSALEIVQRPNEAPRVRCRCGQLVILLKGSVLS